MKESKLYYALRPIVVGLYKLIYHPKIKGKENIPKNGRVLLAGTHTSNMDCFMMVSVTKRPVHFLAKIELFKGPFGWFFKSIGLIPVDRNAKSPSSIVISEKYLNDEKLVLIFPEGTTQKGRGLLPFKKGAIKIASDTNTPIIPFVIKGKYRPFINNLSIEILKPINVSDDIVGETERLRNIIKEKVDEQ